MLHLESIFFGRLRKKRAAQAWHFWIHSVARDPGPYREGWVQDTFEGRFQMVALVSALVFRRLRDLDDHGVRLADWVYRTVFDGFDHALREEGVGDATIARRMRSLGEQFFGLARRIDNALGMPDPDQSLARAFIDNGICDADDASEMVRWLRRIELRLGDIDDTELRSAPQEIWG